MSVDAMIKHHQSVTEAMVDVALKAFHSVGQYASERARIKAALKAAMEAKSCTSAK